MADALHGFDMVLALTENAVNAQLEALYKEGLRDPNQAIMPAEVDWKIPNGRGTIKAKLGATSVDFMPNNSNYQQATFILPLTSGTFTTYTIDTTQDPPKAVPQTITIDNWQVAFVVNLKQIPLDSGAQKAANAAGALSNAAQVELARYPSADYDVTALVLDFTSANIAAFDKTHTNLPGLTGDHLADLANAMTVYFQQERKQPYIVGIHASSRNPATTAPRVAPTLVPTAVSYTTYGNPSTDYNPPGPPQGLSTLNYLTSTDGHGAPPAKPNGIFTAPFVTDNHSSGQLLISRAAFVENFLLQDLGRSLHGGFSTSNLLTSVSRVGLPGVSYSKSGSFFHPGSVSTSGSTTITTTATLSTSEPVIEIKGTIATYANFKITFIWSGTWQVWKNIDFSGTISIKGNGSSLVVEFPGFSFSGEYAPRPDQKDTGANVDSILSLGTIDGQVSNLLSGITHQMESWDKSVIASSAAAVPAVFVPPTGAPFSLAPRSFNASGDLVIDIGLGTAASGASHGIPLAESGEAVATSDAKDDLKKIEGIGPKIEGLLNGAGIHSWQQLADSPADSVREVLDAAGPRYNIHDPATWAEQAKLAAKGQWDDLKTLQDQLKGGK